MSGVASAIRRLAGWIEENADELADRVVERLHDELPQLGSGNDPAMVELERNSARANLKAITDGLADGRMLPAQLPSGAADLALSMANQNVPWTALLRRHLFGHAELFDRVLEEVEHWDDLEVEERSGLLRVFSRYLFLYRDFVTTRLTEVYQAERERLVRSREHRRIGLVLELLAGLPVSEAELGYRLQAHHVGAVAWGSESEAAMAALARLLGGELLVVPGAARSLWGWCGQRSELEPGALAGLDPGALPEGACLALGGPAFGIEGFGRTHREAMRAFRVVGLRSQPLTRYDEVALEALALADERGAREFAQHELGSLAVADARTATLRDTLRAYFLAGQNRSAAAASLAVHERTVGYRLGKIEQLLGHQIGERQQELGVALRIHALLDA